MEDTTKFKFSITVYTIGPILTYHISRDSFEIITTPSFNIVSDKDFNKSISLYKIEMDSMNRFNLMQLGQISISDTLESKYNPCIIDGMRLHFQFSRKDRRRELSLFNEYLEEMKPFVDFANELAPKEYEICYCKGCTCDASLYICP